MAVAATKMNGHCQFKSLHSQWFSYLNRETMKKIVEKSLMSLLGHFALIGFAE